MTRFSATGLDVEVAATTLCHDLDLNLVPGQCWAILGGNGSGKTTLLLTLAGLLYAARGTLLLDEKPLSSLSRRSVARQLGLLLQEHHTPFPATVLDTVLSGRHPHLGRWQQEQESDLALAREAMRVMDLQSLEQRMVQSLSGGERRRVEIATLLTQAPQILLLDEPLNHLDLHHQQRLLKHLSILAEQGKSVVMVLHDPNQALRYCDQALLLFGNGEWESGECEELLSEQRLSRLYNHPIRVMEQGEERFILPL